MNHPKIKHAIAGENVGSNIPWSAAAELHLRRRITAHWAVMWTCLIFAAVELTRVIVQSPNSWASTTKMAVWLNLFPFTVLFGGAITNLFLLAQSRDRLGEEMRRLPNGHWFPGSGMLANKPRSTSTLTEWFSHPPVVRMFICPGCGATLDFKKMGEWIPNHDPDQRADGTFPDIDPGGGRWVILCACGVGHYKLRS